MKIMHEKEIEVKIQKLPADLSYIQESLEISDKV